MSNGDKHIEAPVKLKQWQEVLATHPDQQFAQYKSTCRASWVSEKTYNCDVQKFYLLRLFGNVTR